MLQSVHVQVMQTALSELVSARALRVMIRANVWVDAIWNQLGRHELHFDANAFEAANAYLALQRRSLLAGLAAGDPGRAWRAFGRLTHTAQDFYSHSNYVDLWIACHPAGQVPPALQIDPLDPTLTASPALRSGKVSLPVEILSYLPLAGDWFRRMAPHDSHAQMNLDSAARGPTFDYAFQAAVKRTRAEYDAVRQLAAPHLFAQFRDLPS